MLSCRRVIFTYFRLLLSAVSIFFILLAITSCEPLATDFEDTEGAICYSAETILPVPDTFTVVRVMTWNIRFGAGRLPWFGDACGNRVILTEDEVYGSLQSIVNKINLVKPDVLLLQEVDLNSKRSCYIDQLRWIMDHTYFNYAVYGSQWKAQFIPSDGLGRMDEGNVILSRWKISNAQRIQLALRSDQDNLTRYFYERCCMVTGQIEIPRMNNFYAVNIHASAFATDETKQKHIGQFKEELDRISNNGGLFVAGGDLNTLPPDSDTTDYCLQDMCSGESFHGSGDDPQHKEGSNYEPEKHWLDSLYARYACAVPADVYKNNQFRYFTHTTRGAHFWDRTLDYLFTNYQWVDHSVVTHQDATKESDHAPVSVLFILPK
ncbi:MAG: endonuclease/exonuclease/phosphatase family protein [Bacteroidetes bacterium]|nr:endonuclease/exonuclease/phosphatase family protein [Bacteroidota bacterium]